MTITSTDPGAPTGGWLLVVDDAVVRPEAPSEAIARPWERVLGLSVDRKSVV